jgi:hypothetical protein
MGYLFERRDTYDEEKNLGILTLSKQMRIGIIKPTGKDKGHIEGISGGNVA